ncbi:putative laccase [Helianthus annuus]|uniref:Laccase n=1 Tax=Helianthus annuus TaxID=4232 RepID=A0A9K3IWF1_HELAN|nr:putative laccase [Helianthus annuus]KAJ0568872.1 putative laccase [Helianthus annuus]KAJ0583158.1 putative laccase [Helianthus annuus]KAJ0745896.1 putative laccase [Helianthus annuus]KAJ0917273.1 putative laccase [Helianthus annuus]
MLGPGQTLNVLVTADQKIGRYSMSAQNVSFQNITSIAYFQYIGATPNSVAIPASLLPRFNDNLAVMDGLKSLEIGQVPKEIDMNLFFTNVNKCGSKTPNQNCQGVNGGVMAASMNNVNKCGSLRISQDHHLSFMILLTEHLITRGQPTELGPKLSNRVQLILQDTGTVTTENHPIHLQCWNNLDRVRYGSSRQRVTVLELVIG